MLHNTWSGFYDYRGFTIWSPSEKQWIAEPDWCEQAIDNYKSTVETHTTINKAKKWVRDVGIHLKEEDYMPK